MDLTRRIHRGSLVSALCCVVLSAGSSLQAASFPEFVDPNPAVGNAFGSVVLPLSTGNVVITSPGDDFGGSNAGAVYLFNGSTGALISTLRGSTANDQVGGGGVTALTSGNYLVRSPSWDNGATVDAGAVTWGSGTTGISGTVSAANSLVGSTASDQVGSGASGVVALISGNYVVRSPSWDNGATVDVGAVTWGSGTTGISGTVSAANSLVGSTASDQVGSGGVTVLANGNYVVRSPNWDNGATVDVGAVTWGSGTTGISGTVSAANSLAGSTASDQVGSGASGVVALTNGNYVVRSPSWDNGPTADAGAVTWGSGTTGISGTVSAANSLVGSIANDQVGFSGVTVLTNGNYVVRSPFWDNVAPTAATDAGAATWGNGTTGISGTVSAANSLVSIVPGDNVGSGGVTALGNGNYVVLSPNCTNTVFPPTRAGAATWGSGATGISGTVSTANSLLGTTLNDNVGSGGVTALTNGNYVVLSPNWDNGANADAGAATWGSGTTGISGIVSAANSLVGSTASDQVGFSGVTALTNGNYVVQSQLWDNGATVNAGAVTWGSGTTGISGTVSAANSLVGSTASDQVGSGSGGFTGVTALTNGDYVVTSFNWDNGAIVNAGAATWGSGGGGAVGVVSPFNSLVGSTASTSLSSATGDPVNDTFLSRFVAEGGGRVRVGPANTPVIVSAVDIPSDQGGWLRLTFLRSSQDDFGRTPPIATYGVWRHVPGTFAARAGQGDAASATRSAAVDPLRSTLPAGLEVWQEGGQLLVTVPSSRSAEIAEAFPPGTWELVASVPAVQQAQYVVAVPTISNAAPNDFVVTAHATSPGYWVRSRTISAQSVDNLAPAQPTQFTAAYAAGQTNLQWAANTEHDLGTYRLYRGASADFAPSIGNRIASPTGTSYADVGPAGSYYKLSAEDVNGNESPYALVTPQMTTGVGVQPVAFALEGVQPNPASRHGLNVAFALPSAAPASIELLDVGGRRVLSREVGSLGAGRHTVNLAEGRNVKSGIYWVRLTQGANQQRMRCALID